MAIPKVCQFSFFASLLLVVALVGCNDAPRSSHTSNDVLADAVNKIDRWGIISPLHGRGSLALAKTRYNDHLKELAASVATASAKINDGHIQEGVNALRRVLNETRDEAVYSKALEAARQAGPVIRKEGEKLVQQRKYLDAINTFALGIRDYLMIAEATRQAKLDPAADDLMKSLGAAAKQGNTPNSPFRVLSEAIAFDPDDKVANTELSRVYLARDPADYPKAIDLLKQAGATDAEINALRDRAQRATLEADHKNGDASSPHAR